MPLPHVLNALNHYVQVGSNKHIRHCRAKPVKPRAHWGDYQSLVILFSTSALASAIDLKTWEMSFNG
jgi:hypothetical protein